MRRSALPVNAELGEQTGNECACKKGDDIQQEPYSIQLIPFGNVFGKEGKVARNICSKHSQRQHTANVDQPRYK